MASLERKAGRGRDKSPAGKDQRLTGGGEDAGGGKWSFYRKETMRLIVLLLLTGCATQEPEPVQPEPQGYWVRAGATKDQFITDRGFCVSQAFAAYSVFQQNMIMIGCMQSKGWRWETK